jgi:hypothetical protein
MLNIVFTALGERDCAKYMIDSVKKQMPNCNLIQLSDWNTPELDGIDTIYRHPALRGTLPEKILKLRMGWHKDGIYLDDDVIVVRPLDHLMDDDFDVIVCEREYSDGTPLTMRKLSPYNTGVMACKSRQFWFDCMDELSKMKQSFQEFGGEQIAIGIVADSGKYRVKKVEGKMYNRVPKKNFKPSPATYIWHYKGDRKTWIKDHVATY